MTLLELGKDEYRLFDSMRMRFLKVRCLLAPEEVGQANERLIKSLCPHLKWTKEMPESVGENK